VAKNEQTRRALQRQFKARQVHKMYVALLDGHVEAAHGRIEAAAGPRPAPPPAYGGGAGRS